MITYTEEAQKHLDKYLNEVRVYLSGCKTVDVEEIQRDIIEHVETELEGTAQPISYNDLDAVLKKLGSPRQWVPEEELSTWQKIITRLRTGPEDWRLAYISLGLLILAFIIGRRGSSILVLASFVVSRAALSVAGDPAELKEQKWLIYPSLILVYVILAALAVLWIPLLLINNQSSFFIAGVTLGLWCVVLGLVLRKWHYIIKKMFYPFTIPFKRKWARMFIFFGVLLTILSGLLAILEEVF